MKIDAVVVLYNPENDVFDNIKTYATIVEKLFVIDNSSIVNQELVKKLLSNYQNIEYVCLNGNLGIAKALNTGVYKAVDDQADFCLTMDQDSKFPTNKIEDIKAYLSRDLDEYGIITLNAIGVDENKYFVGIKDVKFWITSGNFLVLKNFVKTNGFMEELFIDSVDFQMCEQFCNINKKIGVIGDITIEHKIGEPTYRRFLWKKLIVDNHSPIRYYYMYRNTEYLYRRNKKFYAYFRRIGFKSIIIQLLVGRNRRQRLKMIFKGKKDGKKGILGEYKEK